jgi:hypothetical protein
MILVGFHSRRPTTLLFSDNAFKLFKCPPYSVRLNCLNVRGPITMLSPRFNFKRTSRDGEDEAKGHDPSGRPRGTCFIDTCLFLCCESKQPRICSTATASSWPPSSPASSARESFPWVHVVTAIVLCPLVEAVIVALVHALVGVLVCVMWPSSTTAAIASLVLRPAATIDGLRFTAATPAPRRSRHVTCE